MAALFVGVVWSRMISSHATITAADKQSLDLVKI